MMSNTSASFNNTTLSQGEARLVSDFLNKEKSVKVKSAFELWRKTPSEVSAYLKKHYDVSVDASTVAAKAGRK
jgi:F0F1-type ATP synthase delta subunit